MSLQRLPLPSATSRLHVSFGVEHIMSLPNSYMRIVDATMYKMTCRLAREVWGHEVVPKLFSGLQITNRSPRTRSDATTSNRSVRNFRCIVLFLLLLKLGRCFRAIVAFRTSRCTIVGSNFIPKGFQSLAGGKPQSRWDATTGHDIRTGVSILKGLQRRL